MPPLYCETCERPLLAAQWPLLAPAVWWLMPLSIDRGLWEGTSSLLGAAFDARVLDPKDDLVSDHKLPLVAEGANCGFCFQVRHPLVHCFAFCLIA